MVIEMRESVVDRYVKLAAADMYRNNRTEISCPCRKCKLVSLFIPSSGIVQEHLLVRGFMEAHTQWMDSDDEDDSEEEVSGEATGNEELQGHQQDGDEEDLQGEQHVEDANTNTPLTAAVRDPHVQEVLLDKTTTKDARGAERRKSKLAQLEVDSNTPLYDPNRGPEESRLKFALEVLKLKAEHGWSDTSVDDLLGLMKKRLPEDNTCPSSLDEAKKIVCPLDLPHTKYHACINDCIIYRKEHADKTKCPVCEADRYKPGTKKSPQKVVWYFPLRPHLQCYFADVKEAKLMRWHAERKEAVLNDPGRIEKPVLTHP